MTLGDLKRKVDELSRYCDPGLEVMISFSSLSNVVPATGVCTAQGNLFSDRKPRKYIAVTTQDRRHG